MRQSDPTAHSAIHHAPRTIAATENQEQMLRGVIYGVVLSLGVWIGAGYLTFILR